MKKIIAMLLAVMTIVSLFAGCGAAAPAAGISEEEVKGMIAKAMKEFAATLLAQMELPHDDFPWSRNVMSPHYSYPFAYSSFPGGILFADSTGMSVYDITGEKSILERPAPAPQRINRAKAILQSSYDRLDAMNSNPTTSPATAQ